MDHLPPKTLVVCAGLQSGGTTLVSYCFLQRGDADGVLDADNDLLPALDPRLARPIAWYKTTISSFRLSEIATHYRDAGWHVRPLLVLRDLRAVWASLAKKKEYGRNGITAEDPPLRLRVRRFVEDWRNLAASNGVILRYEDFVTEPAATLQDVCAQLDLPWDPAMLSWPKPAERIAHRNNGNESFWATRGEGLLESLAKYQRPSTPQLSAADLTWLETEFRDYNEANGYPLHLAAADVIAPIALAELSAPSFEVTRRYVWETSRKPFRWLLAQFGRRNTKLIDQRSWKRAA